MRLRLITLDHGVGAPRHALGPTLAESVALTVGAGGSQALILNENEPHVLLGPRDRRLPGIGAGITWLQARGLLVLERIGGGSAVLLDEGCLTFGVAIACKDLTRARDNFTELTQGLLRALTSMGIAARFGATEGAFCDGPYDVKVEGRKVCGIAQAIRRGFALVSGMILVSQDPVASTQLLTGFYARAGAAPALRPGAVTSLTRELGRPVCVAEVVAAMVRGYGEIAEIVPSRPSPAEWERAARLLAERRIP